MLIISISLLVLDASQENQEAEAQQIPSRLSLRLSKSLVANVLIALAFIVHLAAAFNQFNASSFFTSIYSLEKINKLASACALWNRFFGFVLLHLTTSCSHFTLSAVFFAVYRFFLKKRFRGQQILLTTLFYYLLTILLLYFTINQDIVSTNQKQLSAGSSLKNAAVDEPTQVNYRQEYYSQKESTHNEKPAEPSIPKKKSSNEKKTSDKKKTLSADSSASTNKNKEKKQVSEHAVAKQHSATDSKAIKERVQKGKDFGDFKNNENPEEEEESFIWQVVKLVFHIIIEVIF